MLQKIYKKLRSDKANTLLENVIILPLIIIIIYFMILASFVIHDHSTLDAAAKRGTIYAARCVSDPNYPMILQQSGHQSGTLDTNVTALSADSFKGVGDNIKPYRYLVMNTADIQDATANEVYNIIQQTKIPWREIETGDIVVKVDNKIIYQNVEVSITARYPLPQIFGNFGLPTEFNYTVSAVTAVNDPDEFIRNVDLIVDVCAAIDQKTGGNIQKVLAKLNDMGTRLTQFLSGENGVGGSGGGGTNPAGGSGGESENIYIADAGENGGDDADTEAGESGATGGLGFVYADQGEDEKPQEGSDALEGGTTEGEEATPQQIRDAMIANFGQGTIDIISEGVDTSTWTEEDWRFYITEYLQNGSRPEDWDIPIPAPKPSSTPEPTATPSVQVAINCYDDFKEASLNIGKRTDLTNEQKVAELQKLLENSNFKTDINVPSDAQYIDRFDSDGTIIYNWPPKLGFEEGTIKPISRTDGLPDTWDRYGHLGGTNFSDVPPTGSYSYSERAIPYVENKEAYHTGTFNNATYFDKIDAIKNGDMDALNKILSDEGIKTVDSTKFAEIQKEYNDRINVAVEAVGKNVDVTYGLKGSVAAWGDMPGGAGQLTTPLRGSTMEELGILKESKS